MPRHRRTVLEIAQGKLPLTEKQEQEMGDRMMAALGFTSIHFSQARASQQTPGIPDRKYYHTGRRITLWWEAKRTKGKQSPAQVAFQEMAQACEETYVYGTHDDLATALRVLLNQ